MMNKIKFLMGVVVGLCIVNIGLMGFILFRPAINTPPVMVRRGVPGPPGMMPEERPRQLIIQKLNFSREQVIEYDKLIEAHRDSIHTLEKQIRNAKNQLYSTLVPGTIAEKDQLVRRLGELQQRMESVHYNHFLEIKKLCRDKQQQ